MTRKNNLFPPGNRRVLCQGGFRIPRPLPSQGELRLQIACRQDFAPDALISEARLSLQEILRVTGASRNPVIKRLPLVALQSLDPNQQLDSGSVPVEPGEAQIKFVVRLINAD